MNGKIVIVFIVIFVGIVNVQGIIPTGNLNACDRYNNPIPLIISNESNIIYLGDLGLAAECYGGTVTSMWI